MVSLNGAGSWLWEGVFFRDSAKKGELLASPESCSIIVDQEYKNAGVYGVFAECECSVAFFDSESSINEIIGKKGKIELLKGYEWEAGSRGVWTASDKSRRVYIAM